MRNMNELLEKNELKNAKDFVLDLFNLHDILLFGEYHANKTTLDFVCDLIPALYQNRVTNLVMEFGSYENQALLDHFIMEEKEYDEAFVRNQFYQYNVRWPYLEYQNIYKAAQAFNQTLKKEDKKFRIINMSYRYKWEKYQGVLSIDTAKEIFDLGCIDLFRSKIIEKEVLDKNEKAFILTGINHAFTKYHQIVFQYDSDNLEYVKKGELGQRLYQKYGSRITNAFVHRNNYDGASPADGLIEEKLQGRSYLGFNLEKSPLGELTDHSSYSFGHPGFKLKDFFDNYIYLKKSDEQEMATIDTHFLDGIDFQEVIRNFPDPNQGKVPKTIEEYWDIVKKG